MSDWTLHHGDCLDPLTGLASLPDKSIDHVITDPPYEAEAHEKGKRQGPAFTGNDYERMRATGSAAKATKRVVDEEFDFAAITEEQRSSVGGHVARLARQSALVFCQVEAVIAWRDAMAGLEYRRTIPWVKPDAMPSLHGRWPGQSFEAIVLATVKGARPFPVGGKAKWYSHTRKHYAREGRPHPTLKPLELMLEIVEDFTQPGDLILDPFMGSGTTGVACRMLGRRFIGWEMNRDYFEIAQRRIAGEEAKPRPEQPSLFGGAA